MSFSTQAGGQAWALRECARWAKANGFDAVRLSNQGVIPPEGCPADSGAEILDTLRSEGVTLAAITAHSNLLDENAGQADAAERRLRSAIENASRLHVPVVVTHAGSPVGWHFYGQFSSPPGNPGDRSAELVRRFRDRFGPVVSFAADRGVRIALDVAVRMGNIACNPEMWERILDAVPSDALGLSCDPSHWVWMGILPAEDAVRLFAGKWYYADVKDCEVIEHMRFRQGIIGNWWWQYRVPGRGQLNWGTLIGALTESGYDYVLCVENEDRGLPGLPGFAYGGRYLRQFLPPRSPYPCS
ncbi:MAG: sugar phosphate isomerase/epimerase [Planctomycetes bacterium]|nr:sugar phosphate isomerase/epimerase [Planctomycetota bacterium]